MMYYVLCKYVGNLFIFLPRVYIFVLAYCPFLFYFLHEPVFM